MKNEFCGCKGEISKDEFDKMKKDLE